MAWLTTAKRLAAMSPPEIGWRLGQKLWIAGERMAYYGGRYDWSASAWKQRLCPGQMPAPTAETLPDWWCQHMQNRDEPPFLLDAGTLSYGKRQYAQLFPHRLAAKVHAADKICRGELTLLGREIRLARGETAWQADPITGRPWPSRFFAEVDIPFCDGTGSRSAAGDVKYVWELNRHEFLITCAQAYWLTQDSRYADHACSTIDSWIGANPFLQGVNWAGPLEVAVRAISWLWVYQFCRAGVTASPDAHLRWIQSFYQHGLYLYRHLERYSSPNNHLVGEAAALYLLGSFFPEFAASATWRRRAWAILRAEPARQYFPDGGTTEQASSYHHYCLGFFLLAVLVRRTQRLPLPPEMLQRLEAACEFSMWLATPDGTVPMIGDTDDARSIRFGDRRPWDFRNLLSIGAVLFRRGDLKTAAGAWSEDAHWLLGESGRLAFEHLAGETPPATTRRFSHSGYAVLRSGWHNASHYTCFDSGCIGIDLRQDDVPMFTHGHADMLSLIICAFGKPLLVEAGFLTYNGPPDWHRYTREAAGHNTVRVDGQSPARFHLKNAWSGVARPGPLRHQTLEPWELLRGSYDGFRTVADCTEHHRIVAWNRSACWVIADQLQGRGSHHVEFFLHFAPGRVEPYSAGRGLSVRTDEGLAANLQFVETAGLACDVVCGGPEPEGGWIATGYGTKRAAPVVRLHGQVTLPLTVTCQLSCRLASSGEGNEAGNAAIPPASEDFSLARRLHWALQQQLPWESIHLGSSDEGWSHGDGAPERHEEWAENTAGAT